MITTHTFGFTPKELIKRRLPEHYKITYPMGYFLHEQAIFDRFFCPTIDKSRVNDKEDRVEFYLSKLTMLELLEFLAKSKIKWVKNIRYSILITLNLEEI